MSKFKVYFGLDNKDCDTVVMYGFNSEIEALCALDEYCDEEGVNFAWYDITEDD